jgi:Nickel responsive protein SCO4226-like
MPYAAKCYWPGDDQRELERITARALRTGDRPARDARVAYVGSLLCSDDDLVLCLFEGPSRAAVKRASDRAGIPCERLMAAAWLAPGLTHRSTSKRRRRRRRPTDTARTNAEISTDRRSVAIAAQAAAPVAFAQTEPLKATYTEHSTARPGTGRCPDDDFAQLARLARPGRDMPTTARQSRHSRQHPRAVIPLTTPARHP